jgi:hypothetical protein
MQQFNSQAQEYLERPLLERVTDHLGRACHVIERVYFEGPPKKISRACLHLHFPVWIYSPATISLRRVGVGVPFGIIT